MTSNVGANNNIASIRILGALSTNNANANKAMSRVTTGLRINSAKDNVSQWGISERMRARIKSLNQANQNIQNGTNLLKTAEDGIGNTVSILQTIKARVTAAADSGATSNEDLVALSKEIYQLMDQVDENAANTRYNGRLLLTTPDAVTDRALNGYNTSMNTSAASASQYFNFQIGDNVGAVISGVKIQNMTLKSLGLDSYYTQLQAVATMDYGTAQVGSAQAVLGFSAAQSSATAQSGTQAGKMLTKVNEALDKALQAATDVGAYEQRLGYTADNVAAEIENLEASDSTIRDADMAREIADYMKYSVLSQSAQYMLAQSNQNKFQVLNLLQ